MSWTLKGNVDLLGESVGMIKEIITYPDYRLKRKASEVDRITPETINLINDLIDTMRDANGAGLAATQIGVLKSVLVMEKHPDPRVFINPTIVWKSQETQTMQESCLSIPGHVFDVERHYKIAVHCLDQNNFMGCPEFEGLESVILQHEIDHLNGILVSDRGHPVSEKLEGWQSWFNAPVLKTDVGETPPWVRIPPPPPYTKKTKRKTK